MAIIAKKKKGDYSTAPEGLWPAVCIDVVDLGLVDGGYGEKPTIEIWWALDQIDPESSRGNPYMVKFRATNSLHEKSRLRPLLEAWRGRKFTSEELEGFDLERLIGANCQLQVIHNITDKGTYANVQAVVPAPRGVTKMSVPNDYVRFCDRPKQHEDGNGNGSSYQAADEDIPF